MRSNKFVAGVLIPAFGLIFVFLILPLFFGLGISFFDYNPLRSENPFVGLANFERLLQDATFRKALVNTIQFVFVTVAINIVFTLILAQCISILPSNALRSVFRVIFFLPCVAPIVATSSVWSSRILSTKTGIVNAILTSIGKDPINFIGDASLVMWTLILFSVWVDFGYNTILFSAGIDAIPPTFHEAAKIDGANGWQRFRYITLPLLKRTFVFVTIITIISHFQMFVQFMTLAHRGGPNYASTVLTLYVYTLGFTNKDMGYASAVALVLFCIIMIVTMLQKKLTTVDWEY